MAFVEMDPTLTRAHVMQDGQGQIVMLVSELNAVWTEILISINMNGPLV